MPLIILTGLPSSGKSKLASSIRDFIEQRLSQDADFRKVKIISDADTLDWEGRDKVYMDAAKEKELRAWLRAETQRYLSRDQIVILDASAYIKGFRYELFCISKEARTQYCVIEILIDPEVCWRWNEQLRASKVNKSSDPRPGYNRETFDALKLRYEECNENNRWDSPLFRLSSEKEQLDMEEVYYIIAKGNTLAANKCTSFTSTTKSMYKS